jgi:hypothetical protein
MSHVGFHVGQHSHRIKGGGIETLPSNGVVSKVLSTALRGSGVVMPAVWTRDATWSLPTGLVSLQGRAQKCEERQEDDRPSCGGSNHAKARGELELGVHKEKLTECG